MHILLIEDDINLCDTLRFQLEQEQHAVDICHDGGDGLDLFLQDSYDLVLLDRMLPSMSGLSVLKSARKSGIMTPVIVITALGEIYDRIEGLDSGADDYITKPFAFEELMARIRSLGRRTGKWEDNALLSLQDIHYDCNLRQLSGPKGDIQLSGREGRMLEVFLRSPDTVLRRLVLLSRIWGADAAVEESNLDTYVHYLRKRLRYVGSVLQLKTVRGVGYMMESSHV